MNPESKTKVKKERRINKGASLSGQDRAKAVLAIWTGWKPSEVCRQMKISPGQLCQWEQRAMQGMLQALEPRGSPGNELILEAKLERMLEVRSRNWNTRVASLDKRLAQVLSREQHPANATTTPPN